MSKKDELHFDNYNLDERGRPVRYYTDDRGNQFASREMGGGVAMTESAFIASAFLWMMGGLLTTFGVAFFIAFSGVINMLLDSGSLVVVLIAVTVAEFIVVFSLSARIQRLSAETAQVLFFAYAALTGVTFSMYFVIFEMSILILAFAISAVMFGGMAAAAKIFRLQLDSIRPYLFTGLIMLLVLGIANLFLRVAWMEILLCYAGIALFLAYTAYDVTRIKGYYYSCLNGGEAMLAKASIFGAFQLYLDFINLFLRILRILAMRSARSRD